MDFMFEGSEFPYFDIFWVFFCSRISREFRIRYTSPNYRISSIGYAISKARCYRTNWHRFPTRLRRGVQIDTSSSVSDWLTRGFIWLDQWRFFGGSIWDSFQIIKYLITLSRIYFFQKLIYTISECIRIWSVWLPWWSVTVFLYVTW